ncbi:MAG: TetR family transcriptional regulator C-terminal domain-containing protein [Erysipelotrichaceae bacterium]|nr:TetR family transcriptional regulator C-terminal domain-containing protein [Erysipelotrichaceae bacterium]
MYNTSTNKQVMYSLDSLSSSLYDLLRKKSFNDISITELCQNCNITRKTFYRNCDDLYDLIDYSIDRHMVSAMESVSWYHSPTQEIITSFFRYWGSKRDLLSLLYAKGLFPHFKTRLIKIVSNNSTYQRLTAAIGKVDESIKEYYDSFLFGGFLQLMEAWIVHNYELSVEEIAEVFMIFKQGRQYR